MPVLGKRIIAGIVAAGIAPTVQSPDIWPPARTFPLIVSILTASLAALALVRSIWRPVAAPQFAARRGRVALLSVAGFLANVLILPVGYISSTLAFRFCSSLFVMPRR